MVIGTDFTNYDFIANDECAFDIEIEDFTTCRCNHLIQTFLVITASIYKLNIQLNITYSKKVEATMPFIRRM